MSKKTIFFKEQPITAQCRIPWKYWASYRKWLASSRKAALGNHKWLASEAALGRTRVLRRKATPQGVAPPPAYAQGASERLETSQERCSPGSENLKSQISVDSQERYKMPCESFQTKRITLLTN